MSADELGAKLPVYSLEIQSMQPEALGDLWSQPYALRWLDD